MKTTLIAGIVTACVLGFGGCSAVATAISTNNKFVALETGLETQYKENQNSYSSYFNKLKESAQVPEMYVEDLRKTWDGVMKGRYGSDGSKALFQMITESNPNVDPGMYKQLQQIIEAGRNDFRADQTMLLDKKRVYQTELRTFPGNFLASLLGFPKIDLSKIDIVTNTETEEAFESKKAGPIKLR